MARLKNPLYKQNPNNLPSFSTRKRPETTRIPTTYPVSLLGNDLNRPESQQSSPTHPAAPTPPTMRKRPSSPGLGMGMGMGCTRFTYIYFIRQTVHPCPVSKTRITRTRNSGPVHVLGTRCDVSAEPNTSPNGSPCTEIWTRHAQHAHGHGSQPKTPHRMPRSPIAAL